MKRLGLLAAGLIACVAGLSGCGTPGAPQPPSLHLPQRVADLSAVRAGSQVRLAWTNPKRDTDRVAIQGDAKAAVCRSEAGAACIAVGEVNITPGGKGEFVDTFPSQLASGAPRPVQYFVELKNRHGRSAGQSNAAIVLAGAAPAAVAGFAAVLHRDGVALRWTAGNAGQAVRIYRTRVSAPVKKQAAGPFGETKEAAEQKLLVDSDTGRALDNSVHYGETYEYRAQRVARVSLDGKTLELPGEISSPVRLDVEDVFPPTVPTGLAAVFAPANGATPAAIDLSWIPGTDRNLAGYVVYRREGTAAWVRISPAQPLVGPAFHDVVIEAGRTYRYAVTAVSLSGHESPRSEEAEESAPQN